MENSNCKVCVTGGTGYIGSWLVKKLLQKGYTVHTTLRNLGDQAKVDLLKSIPGADTRLVLFEADVYQPEKFIHAIEGCEFVIHVATPLMHSNSQQFESITEASLAASKSIVMACVQSGVKRLVYTASAVSASPLLEDGSGFKNILDESCWTPLNLSYAYCDANLKEYVVSKTLTEKQLLSYGNDSDAGKLEIVTLVLGLVGGDSLLPYTPTSSSWFVSALTNEEYAYQALRFLEELLGKLPIVHIDDACDAHIFCMEQPSLSGRFLCSNFFVSSAEIAKYYQQNYPEFVVKQEYLNEPQRDIKWEAAKLTEKGFKYMYDSKKIFDDCFECAKRNGDLPSPNMN